MNALDALCPDAGAQRTLAEQRYHSLLESPGFETLG
jgi:hypothetical protein